MRYCRSGNVDEVLSWNEAIAADSSQNKSEGSLQLKWFQSGRRLEGERVKY